MAGKRAKTSHSHLNLWQITFITCLFFVGLMALVIQSYQLNATQGFYLKEQSQQRIYRESSLSPRRGSLFDTNGKVLAIDLHEYQVAIDPKYYFSLFSNAVDDSVQLDWPSNLLHNLPDFMQSLLHPFQQKILQQVNNARAQQQRKQAQRRQQRLLYQLTETERILAYDPGQLSKRLLAVHKKYPNKSYLLLKKGLSALQAQRLEHLDFRPLIITKKYLRRYPQGENFASIIGYMHVNNKIRTGFDGVEKWLDPALQGSSGKRYWLKDKQGNTVATDALSSQPQAGLDIHLTLDKRFQYVLNKALRINLVKHEAKSAIGMLVEIPSGAIRAMTSQPSFNPNSTLRTANRVRLRSAIDRFEPGSTQKPLMVAAALEAGIINASSTIDIPRKLYVEELEKSFYENVYYGERSITEILQYSLNLGMILIARQTPKLHLWQLQKQLGYQDKDYEFISGYRGYANIKASENWKAGDYLVRSYGYHDKISLMEMINFYVSIANNGKLPPLHLVEPSNLPGYADIAKDLKTLRVMSSATAKTILNMLEQAVANGTGKKAQVEGYRVAGKTGTARKVNKIHTAISNLSYRASFIGIIPADRPRYVLAISIEEPVRNEEYHSGGRVAAPIFAEVMTQVMRLTDRQSLH